MENGSANVGINDDLCIFARQMGTLLNSGIKLTEALSVLTIQVSDKTQPSEGTDI